MAKRISVDRVLFVVTLLLVFVGLVMVFSASAVMAKEKYHSGYFFLLRQMGWAIGGFIAMMIGMRLDYKRLKHPAVVFYDAGADHADADSRSSFSTAHTIPIAGSTSPDFRFSRRSWPSRS